MTIFIILVTFIFASISIAPMFITSADADAFIILPE